MPSRFGVRKIFAAFGTAFVLLSSQPAAAHRASNSASTIRTLLGEEDHAHAKVKGPQCACLADAQGWKIDCADKAAMSAALTYLETAGNNCKTKSHSTECEKNYNIINAHHDHCDHDQVPEEIEKELHEFEEYYTDCEIKRKFYTLGGVCDAIECHGASAELTTAIADLAANQCNVTANCASKSKCYETYRKILMAHDTCDDDDLPTTLEKALHDYEEACDAKRCNTVSADAAALSLTCQSSDAAATTSTAGALLLAAIAVATTLVAA